MIPSHSRDHPQGVRGHRDLVEFFSSTNVNLSIQHMQAPREVLIMQRRNRWLHFLPTVRSQLSGNGGGEQGTFTSRASSKKQPEPP